jgi:glycosyltransferase involved in cell wall biosynthesis
MKIIYFSPHPTHDIVTEVGYATHQRETIHALQKLGAEVIPVIMGGTNLEEVPYKEGKAIEQNGLKGFIKKILPRFIWVSIKDFMLMRHDIKAGMKLEKAILEHQPDLIYERSEYLQDSGIKPAKRHGIKYFLEVNAPFVQEMREMEGWSFWLWLGHKKEKYKYQSADIIFVVSSALKEFLVKRYLIDSSKILVSPNKINKEEFLEKANESPAISLNFTNPNWPIIGFVGSILPHHYVDVLIDAFAIIRKQETQANLLIVGGGSLLDKLKLKAKDLGISDYILFTNKVPHKQIPAIINSMDICVMPGSNWYGSPIKIFEYGILGKVVIAPDNGPVKDVMVNEQDGLLIDKDARILADAITKLINNPDLSKMLGYNFRNKIISDYTWEKAGEMILDAFNKK